MNSKYVELYDYLKIECEKNDLKMYLSETDDGSIQCFVYWKNNNFGNGRIAHARIIFDVNDTEPNKDELFIIATGACVQGIGGIDGVNGSIKFNPNKFDINLFIHDIITFREILDYHREFVMKDTFLEKWKSWFKNNN